MLTPNNKISGCLFLNQHLRQDTSISWLTSKKMFDLLTYESWAIMCLDDQALWVHKLLFYRCKLDTLTAQLQLANDTIHIKKDGEEKRRQRDSMKVDLGGGVFFETLIIVFISRPTSGIWIMQVGICMGASVKDTYWPFIIIMYVFWEIRVCFSYSDSAAGSNFAE